MFKNPPSQQQQQQQQGSTTTTTKAFPGRRSHILDDWVDATLQTAQSLDPASYLPGLYWKHRTRPDGRIFNQARPTSVVAGVLQKNALGSALVTLLQPPTTVTTSSNHHHNHNIHNNNKTTHVLAGVTADVGQPRSTAGDLRVTLLPSQHHAALESWLQRILRTVVIDPEQLGIVPGRAAFGLDVTISILNQNGNIRDACLLAAVAALLDTTLPPIVVAEHGRVYTLPNDDDASLERVPPQFKTVLSKQIVPTLIPVPLSMGNIRLAVHNKNKNKNTDDTEGDTSDQDNNNNNNNNNEEEDDSSTPRQTQQDYWLVDPSEEEEGVCDGSICVVVNAQQPEQIVVLDYQGNVSMTHSAMALAVRMAQGRAEELLPLLVPLLSTTTSTTTTTTQK